MKTKLTKESRDLLIGLLIGDGTISNNNSFKLSHGDKQKEYLEWKIKQLNNAGIKNCGLKEYISCKGFNVGKTVYYTRINVTPFIKLLRRAMYKPIKNYAKKQFLNRLDSRGLAIWFMDDGHINIRKTCDKIHGFYLKISTCLPKDQLQIIIDFFKERWDISFYAIKEGRPGKNTYSLCCGTKEGIKFVNIIKEYVNEVPSMKYKIQYDLSQRIRPLYDQPSMGSAFTRETQDDSNIEDIV